VVFSCHSPKPSLQWRRRCKPDDSVESSKYNKDSLNLPSTLLETFKMTTPRQPTPTSYRGRHCRSFTITARTWASWIATVRRRSTLTTTNLSWSKRTQTRTARQRSQALLPAFPIWPSSRITGIRSCSAKTKCRQSRCTKSETSHSSHLKKAWDGDKRRLASKRHSFQQSLTNRCDVHQLVKCLPTY